MADMFLGCLHLYGASMMSANTGHDEILIIINVVILLCFKQKQKHIKTSECII